jgi:hypothetical protein
MFLRHRLTVTPSIFSANRQTSGIAGAVDARILGPLASPIENRRSEGGAGKIETTNMKESPKMLLITKDNFCYPTMFMINKAVNSTIPRC